MAWTPEQQQAIFVRGKNVIVSAGAGSGKTAVLSARILELVKEGTSVSEILVLTFTRAAALEMKERIQKNLRKNGYVEEANKVNFASITTFDAYALELVKKYAYLLGLSPNLTVVDNLVIQKKQEEILEVILDELYLTKDKRLTDFLTKYTQTDDVVIYRLIANILKGLDLIYDDKTYLANYINKFYSEEIIQTWVSRYVQLIKRDLLELGDELYDLKNLTQAAEGQEKLTEYLDGALYDLDHSKTYAQMLDFVSNFKMPPLKSGASEELKKAKANVKDSFDNCKKALDYENETQMYQEIMQTKDDVSFVIWLTEKVVSRLKEFKYKYQAFTFADISKLAIKLCLDYEVVKKEMSKLKEVLVDEYQDTSDLQETFLKAIENNNIYMVGDIKQSIYRFRNANPYNFKEKYERYSQNDGGTKIDLLANFRSRREVLDNVNLIFNALMTNEFGDADYKVTHQMRFGLQDYEEKRDDLDYQLEKLEYNLDKDSLFSAAEVEAFIAASKVKELMTRQVYDKDTQLLRPCRYSDIAIIVDRATNFDLFKEVFEYHGIPLYIDANLNLSSSNFSKIIIALLSLARDYKNGFDNETYRKDLVTVLRSFIYNYTDEEIFKVIKKQIPDPTKLLMRQIDFNQSTSDIFFELLATFEVYDKLSFIGKELNSSLEIATLNGYLLSYSELGYDFDKAISFLEGVFEDGAKIEYSSNGMVSNQVRIMTIHHSKGLEYPYCIFPLLNVRFNQSDLDSKFGFDSSYGIYLPSFIDESKDTIIKKLVSNELLNLDLSEKVRLFYVALTRAREKMIIINPQIETKNLKTYKLKNFNLMLEYINNLGKYKKKIVIDELGLTKEYLNHKIVNFNFKGQEKLEYQETKIDSELLVKGEISKSVSQIIDTQTRYILDLGTKMHEILELIDLQNPDFSQVKINAEWLLKLKNILALPLFKDIAQAKVYQEHEFYFEKDGHNYQGIIDLLLEYPDYFVIIDYKLSNVDKQEYVRQLEVYRNYLASISSKPSKAYLLSLIKEEIKEVF